MKQTNLSPSSIKATEGTFLDMETVTRYVNALKQHKPIEPALIVKEPGKGVYYAADGNHTAYGALIAETKDWPHFLLETDQDVVDSGLPETKNLKTLGEVLEYCRRGHDATRKIGIEFICDYVDYQRMPKH